MSAPRNRAVSTTASNSRVRPVVRCFVEGLAKDGVDQFQLGGRQLLQGVFRAPPDLEGLLAVRLEFLQHGLSVLMQAASSL